MDLSPGRARGDNRSPAHSHADPATSHMPANARKNGSRAEREKSVDEIYERIYVAILEHRLHPGTKLGEERLAKVFGVSRTQIRQVIERLWHESIVTVQPRRASAMR